MTDIVPAYCHSTVLYYPCWSDMYPELLAPLVFKQQARTIRLAAKIALLLRAQPRNLQKKNDIIPHKTNKLWVGCPILALSSHLFSTRATQLLLPLQWINHGDRNRSYKENENIQGTQEWCSVATQLNHSPFMYLNCAFVIGNTIIPSTACTRNRRLTQKSRRKRISFLIIQTQQCSNPSNPIGVTKNYTRNVFASFKINLVLL